MNNNMEDYQLILLTNGHFEELYKWYIEEKHFEQYTCRPLNSQKSYEEYVKTMTASINSANQKNYVLVKKDNYSEALGKIKIFDYNSRNFSAEFGYYLPEYNRNKELGSIMLEEFINIAFKDSYYNLNKLYATTASNNLPSMKLLNKFGLKIDGRIREHYWIGGKKYDQCIYSILKSEWLKH